VRRSVSPFDVSERERDIQTFARVREGDEKAFNTLVIAYAEHLYRFAYLRIREQSSAEDVVQDVFTSLWEKRDYLDVQDNLKSYLYRAVANRVLEILRRRRSQERVEQVVYTEASIHTPVVLNSGAAELDREELARIVDRTLATLPPRTREIFLLSREQGLSYAEIASILNIGLPTIRNQMSRATQALFVAVQKWRDRG